MPSLEALVKAGHEVLCVVTQPDRAKGRGLRIEPTAVKKEAKEAGLKVLQPSDINSADAVKFLKSSGADLFVVIAYGQILSPEILNIPRLFSINAHASLLPKYRGAAPVNWAIINDDKESGITVIKMNEKMDAGEMILKDRETILDSDDCISLSKRLAQKAALCIIKAIEIVENNDYTLIEQDETKVAYAPKLRKDNGLIDWGKTAAEINSLVRGCLNWPGAFTYYKGKSLKIYRARVAGGRLQVIAKPGEIREVSREGITSACGKDCLLIEELQMEGGKKMSIAEFIAGHKIKVGERFSSQP